MIPVQVKPNIGIVNAMVRITLGLTVLAWSTAKMVKKPWRDSYLIVAFLGAMKVAEGILKYCPVTDLAKSSMNNQNGNEKGNQEKPQLKQLLDTFIPKQNRGKQNGTGSGSSPNTNLGHNNESKNQENNSGGNANP